MDNYFCAEYSRQAGEDIIGSGTNHQTYVLVECPTPWAPNALDSKHVPEDLRSLATEVERLKLPVRFLLLAPPKSKLTNSTKVLIYDQQEGLAQGYTQKEFNLDNISQAATVIRQHLQGETAEWQVEQSGKRDIIICTHGSHDKCCARYGNPFYRQALSTVTELSLSNVRIWQASHFGGHRFAPTAIDFPEGRYYGTLDQESFKSILTRSGDLTCLNRVYRGWGMLPTQIQVLERELILLQGWDWFNYKVSGKIIEKRSENSFIKAEINFQKPSGSTYNYRAELLKNESKTVRMKGSCGAMNESEFIKYSVENLRLYSGRLPKTIIRYPEKVAS
ncbi:sucrase ferredoxin [Lyngbya aestuarii]|uniref:sucrase ferredoxin n=1 Tax=Lyngbya aestuarii TaxID=118322 RepID=UPI00403D6977